MLVNPTDIADGVLVNAIWAVGQMVVRPRAGRQAAVDMDIASWADTQALIKEALPDLTLKLSGFTAADAEELAAALNRNEVQGALQVLLATRVTDAPETDATKAREAVRLALNQHRPNQLILDSGAFYAEQLSEYFDEKICAVVANLEGRVGLAGLGQVRAEAYNARIIALLGAIERQVAALADPERGGRVEAEFLKRYRRQVRQNHGRIEPPDFDRRRLIPLDRIYVPTNIKEYIPDVAVIGRRQAPGEPRAVSLSVPDLKRILDRTVLLGDPGGGKTTAVKFLLNEFANDSGGKVPFLVTLRKYAAETPLKWSVAGYIEDTLATLYQTPPPDGFVEGLLLTGRAIVIFDGLDELLDTSRRREVSERVEQFSSAYPLTPILVTSRVVGYDQARLDEEQFTCYRLGGFDNDKVAEYIGKWFSYHDGTSKAECGTKARAFLKESEGAKDLRANPLLLSLMCILYRGVGSLPGDRAGIYTKCAELLFRKWDEQRDLYRRLRADYLVEPTLRHLGWWLFTREDTSAAATEQELASETTRFLHGRGFEGIEEARAAAKEFIEFCRGRMWVFSDAGTTATGDTLYSFTHRTFLEYFAAWQLAATSDTPEDLANRLITSIHSSGWEVVGELAIQIKDRNTDRGADRAYQCILGGIEQVDDQVQRLFIKLLTKWLPGMPLSPSVTRRVTRIALIHLLSPGSMSGLLKDLQQCGTRHQHIVADELGSGIAAMVTSDQESTTLAGLQIALSMIMTNVPYRDEFWNNWSKESATLYTAKVETFSVCSPALRTLALFTSVISIDQALAMPGGFDAISQRYPIIGIGPLVPYPLFMTPTHGGESHDSASVAVSTAVGKYLVDHPTLPWASGPPDRFGSIANYIDNLTKANLDEFCSLGSAAAYAVNAEFRGLERASMGLAIEKMPIPSQFRQLFRDWADGNVNLVELRDQ
jgi:NACHT domain